MCGETFPTEDELILVEVDGISMGVCAECATEIELR
jgi:ribosome-binding protein aMBF1 (putative translation factor)